MKAVVYQKYGPPEVLRLSEVDKPVPKEAELLIKIHATTVTSGDVRLRASDFPPLFWLPARLIFGLFKPKKTILGHEFSGVIEAVGSQVNDFSAGQNVIGTTTMLPAGSYAEYVCIPQKWKHGVVTHKPVNLSFDQAAALPIGSMTAYFLLNKAKIQAGQNILIYGASGSVGSYGIQIANCYGATVTAVCSAKNFEMVKSLGASNVIDYKTQDYTSIDKSFDIVFDAVGKTKKSLAKKVLTPNGTFVSVEMMTQEKIEHLSKVVQWVEQEKIKPFIDRTYPLDKIVTAHAYVDSGRKKGNIIIRTTDNQG